MTRYSYDSDMQPTAIVEPEEEPAPVPVKNRKREVPTQTNPKEKP